jgi:hypothetical protein
MKGAGKEEVEKMGRWEGGKMRRWEGGECGIKRRKHRRGGDGESKTGGWGDEGIRKAECGMRILDCIMLKQSAQGTAHSEMEEWECGRWNWDCGMNW